jgi:hypothetical protein
MIRPDASGDYQARLCAVSFSGDARRLYNFYNFFRQFERRNGTGGV